MNKVEKKWLLISLVAITITNLLSAALLELYADEAYYYMYSLFPDWGYLDHPPAVGMLIYLGTLISNNEFGVRLLFVLLTTASYFFLYLWIRPDNFKVFWLVVFALFPLQLMGFMALPDVPVFFFAILFFQSFQRYIKEDSLLNIFILALSIAGMLYSKYHGVLIVIFAFVSHPHFFLKKSFYVLTLISVILYLPHFIWLYQHSFSSITYHLFERTASVYKINFTTEYLASFIFYNGPLVFILLLWQVLSRQSSEIYERTLKFTVIGIFAFFLFSSFKGRVEANWTFLVIPPVLYLSFKPGLRFEKAYKTLAIISLLLIVLFRIHLIQPLVSLKKDRAYEYHGHQEFAAQIMEHSQGKPVVASRYQEASLLSFYAKQLIPAININSRKNQFDFWNWVDNLENKDVLMLRRGEAPEGVKSFIHPYFGNYYLEEIKQLPLLRYPEILIHDIQQSAEGIAFDYVIKTQNQVNTQRSVAALISLYNEQSGTDSLILLNNKNINEQEHLKQKLTWNYHLPPNYLEISVQSDSLGVWKTRKTKLD